MILEAMTKLFNKIKYLYFFLVFFTEVRAQNGTLETLILKINPSRPFQAGYLQKKNGSEILKMQETAPEGINSQIFHIVQSEAPKQSYKFVGYRSIHLKAEATLAHIFMNSRESYDLIYSIQYLKTKLESSYKDSFVIRDEQSYYGERFYLNFNYEKALCFELLDSKSNLLIRAIRQGLNTNEAHLYIFQKKKSKKIMPFVTTLIMMQISGTSPMKIRYNKVKFQNRVN